MCKLVLIRAIVASPEGLGEVVIGAGIEPFDPCLFAGAPRQQQDRSFAQVRVGAQRPQQAKAIETRHHDIGEHKIGLVAAGPARAASPSATASTS
jgi:hypothetical protein